MSMSRLVAKVVLTAMALFIGMGAAFAQTNLILTTMTPPGGDFSAKFFHPWAERMTAASKGSLKIDARDGFAIANYGNVFDRVMEDVVQIGWGMQGTIAGRFPLTEVATFPFEADNAEQASVALWRVYKGTALNAEYKDVKPLVLGTFPMNGVHYAKKPVSLDNFKGLKVRAASKPQSDWIERLGGAPISMPAEDLYTALQRGIIDVTLQGWSAFGAIKLADVTSFHLDLAFGTSTIMLFMSQAKYDSLPPDARKAIDDNSGEAMSRAWGKFCDDLARGLRDSVLAQPNQTEGKLTVEQAISWREKVIPVTDQWTASHKGGVELLTQYRAALADVKAGR
jgi:TRAP-type C4-dicarboxylate transport system substrate-binding protein